MTGIAFTVLYRRADRAAARSVVLYGADIDAVADRAIADCPADEYVAGVVQTDTPADLIEWHVATQGFANELHIELKVARR